MARYQRRTCRGSARRTETAVSQAQAVLRLGRAAHMAACPLDCRLDDPSARLAQVDGGRHGDSPIRVDQTRHRAGRTPGCRSHQLGTRRRAVRSPGPLHALFRRGNHHRNGRDRLPSRGQRFRVGRWRLRVPADVGPPHVRRGAARRRPLVAGPQARLAALEIARQVGDFPEERGSMTIIANTAIALVAILHFGFLVLEMFLWTRPLGLRTFGTTPDFARASKALAANQGLYNGFVATGLGWGLVLGDAGTSIKIFFLGCVVVAGVFGGFTASRKILWVQALPGAVALALVLLA